MQMEIRLNSSRIMSIEAWVISDRLPLPKIIITNYNSWNFLPKGFENVIYRMIDEIIN